MRGALARDPDSGHKWVSVSTDPETSPSTGGIPDDWSSEHLFSSTARGEGSCWNWCDRAPTGSRLQRPRPAVPLDITCRRCRAPSAGAAFQDGPTIVAGHSYGGQIITALGTEARNVVGLVYIAAFGLDEGESLGALLSQGPVAPALAHSFYRPARLQSGCRRRTSSDTSRPTWTAGRRAQCGPSSSLSRDRVHDRDGGPGVEVAPELVPRGQGGRGAPPEAERQFAARMGATTVESRPAMSRWSRTQTTLPASSRRRPSASEALPHFHDLGPGDAPGPHLDRPTKGRTQ